jgi:hypothetical protein
MENMPPLCDILFTTNSTPTGLHCETPETVRLICDMASVCATPQTPTRMRVHHCN